MKKISFNISHIKKYKKELIMAVAGIFLMLIAGNIVSDNSDKKEEISKIVTDRAVSSDSTSALNYYAEAESERLKRFLSEINGVGETDVIIYVATSSKIVNATEYNSLDESTEETDSNGGKRVNSKLDKSVSYKVVKDANGNESLFHIYDEYPEIKGVVISAKGAKSNTVKEMIIEAVSALYDIPVHKISVVEKAH